MKKIHFKTSKVGPERSKSLAFGNAREVFEKNSRQYKVSVARTPNLKVKNFARNEWLVQDILHYGKDSGWLKEKNYEFFITEKNKVISCAYCHCLIGVFFIDQIIVKESLRGQGIAGLVLQEIIKTAKKRGCHKICLETGADWNEAIAFYKQKGFKITAKLEKHFGGKNFVQMSLFV